MGIAWNTAPTAAVIDHALAQHRDAAQHLDEAHEQVWVAMDPTLLELMRLRIAMLLGNETELAMRTPAATNAGLEEATIAALSEWPTSPRFASRERAVLEFVEQWVIDVASLTDEQAAAVSDELGPEGLATLAACLLVIEQRQRLRLAWTRLFAEAAA